jgi:hypothetical protein
MLTSLSAQIVARGDRYVMKNLGSDIAMLVFQRLKRDRALNGAFCVDCCAVAVFAHSPHVQQTR